MILSIVILSYNRPSQIRRILENFIGVPRGDFELVIKDDRSPRLSEIEELATEYQSRLGINLRLHANRANLGYDRNLIDAFSVVDSEYVFLLSDDDYVAGEKIGELLDLLSERRHMVYFTPYGRNGYVNRQSAQDPRFSNFAHIIYNSILFSGLIFERASVINLDKNMDFLSNCIYSQVYLAAVLIFETGSYGFVPAGILFLGGDGENFFGKNEAAVNRSQLKDREHIAADLKYQVFLINVVREIALRTDKKIEREFSAEYAKRLVSYGLRARSLGVASHFSFLREYLRSDIPFYFLPFISFIALFFMPKKVSKSISTLAVRSLRKSG